MTDVHVLGYVARSMKRVLAKGIMNCFRRKEKKFVQYRIAF